MSRVLIIAEAGVNHNGDLSKAKALINAAADAGADFVKFQTFKAAKLVSSSAKMAEYQKKNIEDRDLTQFEMLSKLELSESDHDQLITHCKERGIKFLSTAFDLDGLRYLNSLNLELFKIPSGEITNRPYLMELSRFGRPLILSTGMATIDEIKEAVAVLSEGGVAKDQITILHCNTEYPTPMKDVNLKAMLQIGKEFGVEIGYSDHTLGIEVPIAAVALGARVIEKHFTLDRDLPGPDHKASLEPDELKDMVTAIRNVEVALSGSGIKEPSESELKNIAVARKSVHLTREKRKGDILKESDLVALRPGDGISPMQWESLVGKGVAKDLPAFHKLDPDDIF